mgnify:FL=1
MAENIAQRVNKFANKSEAQDLRILLNSLIDGIRVVTAKLDADAGVTDTNYTVKFDEVITK